MQTSVVSFGPGPSFVGAGIVVLALVLLVAWFLVASSSALKGDRLDQPNRMAQLYGYTVCLVSVVVGLVSLISMFEAAFDRAHPLQDDFGFGASLVSFETYKATLPRERAMMGPGALPPTDTASDATLRARYNALVQERTAATKYRSSKKLVMGGITLLLCAALFLVHWRWLARIPRAAASG